MNVSATQLSQAPGGLIDQAIRTPVIVERRGKPTVVLLDYQLFLQMKGKIL